MDRDLRNFVPQNGMDVIGADGEKVGEIDAVESDRDYFIVRKGFFFPQDHYIPLTAISSYDEDKVYLNVTKEEALEQEWGNPPATTGEAYGDTTYGQGTTTTADADYVAADIERPANADVDYADENNVAGTIDRDYAARDVNVDDDRTVEVHEEELAARTREVERGEVRIDKDVVEEQQTLEVPVTEEEVDVTRRRVDRPVTDADHAFEEGTIEVPLRGEEVEVEKRARVVEEIDIDKTAREHTEQVSDTVRREDVHVEGDNIDVDRTDRKDDGLI